MLEGGFALGDEGGHALLLVLGGEGRVEQPALEAHPFGQRRLEGAVDRLLDHHRDRPRPWRAPAGGRAYCFLSLKVVTRPASVWMPKMFSPLFTTTMSNDR